MSQEAKRATIVVDLPTSNDSTPQIAVLGEVLYALSLSLNAMESHGAELEDFGYADGDYGESVAVTVEDLLATDSLEDDRIGGSDALDQIAALIATWSDDGSFTDSALIRGVRGLVAKTGRKVTN